jgi:hypothetical protein
VRVHTDAEADMVSAEASTAICVQRFDDSRNSAIHTTYRISLRSSSLREPRYPLLRVVFVSRPAEPRRVQLQTNSLVGCVKWLPTAGGDAPTARPTRETAAHAFQRSALGGTDGVRVWMWMDSMILPQVHLTHSSQRGLGCTAHAERRLAPGSFSPLPL